MLAYFKLREKTELTSQPIEKTGVILVICLIELYFAVYRPFIDTGLKGVSEVNLVILILIFLVLFKKDRSDNKFIMHKHDFIIIIYVFYNFFSFLYSGLLHNFSYTDFFVQYKASFNPIIIYFLLRFSIRNLRQAMALNDTLIIILIYVSTYSFELYLRFRGSASSVLRGIVGQPNTMGMFIITLFPLLLFADISKKGMGRLFKFGTISVVLMTLILTGSRGAFLGFTISMGIALAEKKKFKLFVYGLAVILLITPVMLYGPFEGVVFNRLKVQEEQEIGSYSSGRWEAWIATLNEVAKKPILGHGFNSFKYVFAMEAWGFESSAHNEYIQLLYEQGILGLLLYLSIFMSIWIYLFKNKNPISDAGRYGLTAFLVAISFNNAQQNNFILWAMAAVSVIICDLLPKNRSTI